MIHPEFANQIHNANRIIGIDGKLKEIIDFLKMYQDDDFIPGLLIRIIIDKLEKL